MRMIQVGCLGMGKHWVKVGLEQQEVEIVGYVDVAPEHLQEIQKEFHISPDLCYTDFTQALDELKPDAVLIVTPPQFHEAIAIEAMEAGCHVLTEKPLADTWEACRRVVAASKETGKTVMVAQNYRYRPVVQQLRTLLAEERYGRPGQVFIEFFRGPRFGGFREEMPYPLIIDMSIHHYDMMRYILNADPVSIYASSWNPAWSWYKGDASSTSLIDMRLNDGSDASLSVTYTASWCSIGGTTPWNGHWSIFCDGGCIKLRQDRIYVQTEEDGPLQEITADPMPLTDQPYLLHEFYQAVKEGRLPETHAADNIKSIEMVFRTVEAIESGQKVTLEGA